ncbi:MAG: HIT family protein [Nanoarchaeota archaeon]
MKDCIFCKIIKKEIPSDIVFEDSKVIAFLDINPASKGHTLVMPKNHYELVSEMSDDDCKHLMVSIKRISDALMKLNQGLNIVQNNKKVANQLVPHVHFHLIPRNDKDGIKIGEWAHVKYKDNEASNIIKKIKEFIE